MAKTTAAKDGAKLFGFLVIAIIALISKISPVSAATSDALVIFNEVNEVRMDNGLEPLSWSKDLASCADVRAEEASVVWSHTRPNGGCFNTVNKKIQGGENLAFVEEGNEAEIIGNWMASPTHADNILFGDFTKAAVSTFNSNGTVYVSLEFGY